MRLKLLLSAIFFFSMNLANADKGGIDTSGGGGAVEIQGSVYLFDLFEAGLHTNPFFFNKTSDIDFDQELRKSALPAGAPVHELSLKLQDVEDLDAYLAAALFEGIKLLSWRIVEQPLAVTADFGKLDTPVTVLQFANRRGNAVQIQKQLWDKADAKNRAALIIHETLAALRPPEAHGNQGPLRRLVALLFDKGFYEWRLRNGQEAFAGFPSLDEVKKRATAMGVFRPLKRNFTRVVLDSNLTLRAGAKFILSPHLGLQWSDRRNVLQKINALEFNEMTSPEIVPGFFHLGFVDYCRTPQRGFQLLGFTIEYYKMKVGLTGYQKNGNTLPMLSWELEPNVMSSILYSPNRTQFKANCTQKNLVELESFKAWSEMIRGETRNEN